MASVTLDKINKVFGSTHIIKDVDLAIGEGEFVVFVGPSGCGKSTLLRLIAGLESITDGELSIGDQVVNELPPRERGVGMVFQSYALYPHMTVYENMAFGLKLAKTAKETVHERVMATARILQLEELLERKPKALSGGQRQRVAMGRAMAREPRILLFDEPLSNLDASLRVQMRNEIARLHKRLGSTMVYVTHDQVEAMTLADRMLVMNGGVAEQVGTPLDVYRYPASLFVAGFIGSPAMNFLPGTVADDNAHVVLQGGHRLATTKAAGHADRDVIVGVRPEHLHVAGEADKECEIKVHVELIEALGADTVVHGRIDGQGDMMMARLPGIVAAAQGDTVVLAVEHGQLHLFDETTGRALA